MTVHVAITSLWRLEHDCRSQWARLASATAPTSCPRSQKWSGDTNVDTGIEMAVGTLVACDSADLSLGVGLSFACGRARARGQQDCLQYHERLSLEFRE